MEGEFPEYRFQPANLTIQAGDSVTWTNNTTATHTASYPVGCLPPACQWTTAPLPAGQSGTIQFPNAGTFAYYCRFHPDTRGTIVVAALSTPTPPPTSGGSQATPRPAALSQTGGGAAPVLPIAALVTLLGLALLRLRRS